MKATVIDYGAGNLSSIRNALTSLGADVNMTDKPEDILGAGKLVLPGVGCFGFLADSLRERGLMEPLGEAISKGIPYFGICLGMQILFPASEESPGSPGLGLLDGSVVKFTEGKIPQLGWNKVVPAANGGLLSEGYGYFANSYKVVCNTPSDVSAQTDYGGDFPSAVSRDNITAVQFHPEKSGEWGLKLLQRWLEC